MTEWNPANTKPDAKGYYPTRTKWAGEMELYWDQWAWKASENSPRRQYGLFDSAREWRLPSPVVAA